MALHTTDKSVLNHIEQLVAEEKELYAHSEMSDAQRTRLTTTCAGMSRQEMTISFAIASSKDSPLQSYVSRASE